MVLYWFKSFLIELHSGKCGQGTYVKNWTRRFMDFFCRSKEPLHVENRADAYLKAFENSGIYAILDSSFKTTHANRQFCQIMHIKSNQFLNLDLTQSVKDTLVGVIETIKCKQSWEGTKVFLTSNKEEIHLSCSFVPIFDDNENLYEVLFLATDITELTQSKNNIKKSLYQDSLTKLPNRLKLFTDKTNANNSENSTYIIFNIDSFDSINNLYGNQFGDNILILVARWLEQNLITTQTKLYKLEADVYAMICLEQIKEEDLRVYLRNISIKIQDERFFYNGAEIDISMTIGASQGNSGQLKLAQIAFKEAKKAKKSFLIYDKQSKKEEEYRANIQTSKIIKNAIDKDLIVPHFQPILNIATGSIEKYESLMRVKDYEGNLLSPYQFLDIAKSSKAYPKLSRSLIEKSVETFSLSPCEFSVNLSFLDITNQMTKKFILDLLEKTGIGPWIIFELLESEGIENYQEVMNFIEQVKSYGAKIAIDDFGSGYSNFEHIVELQVDFLKIDGSLIKNIDQNDDMRIIAKTINNFAKELRIKTIAEFVHSQEVYDQVKILGIDYAQGYFIGKPSINL